MQENAERWFFLDAGSAEQAVARGIELDTPARSTGRPAAPRSILIAHRAIHNTSVLGPLPAFVIDRDPHVASRLSGAIVVLADTQLQVSFAGIFAIEPDTVISDGVASHLGCMFPLMLSNDKGQFAHAIHCDHGNCPTTMTAIDDLADALRKEPDLLTRIRGRWMAQWEAQALNRQIDATAAQTRLSANARDAQTPRREMEAFGATARHSPQRL